MKNTDCKVGQTVKHMDGTYLLITTTRQTAVGGIRLNEAYQPIKGKAAKRVCLKKYLLKIEDAA